MRRILHLSDLHFGRARMELLDPLVEAINAAAPHLLVISGDLTQRARSWQFEEARRFFDRLRPPRLVVPGNHDVPLDNLFARLFDPFGRYRRVVGNLEPSFQDEEMLVVGVNTVDPYAWQRGRITRFGIRDACAFFQSRATSQFRVLVAHHPFERVARSGKSVTRGASRAMRALAECGADIVLSGHMHAWRAEPFAAGRGRGGPILVQAGAGLSLGLRDQENDFSILTLERGGVKVERFAARLDAERYDPAATVRFRLGDRGWSRIAAPDEAFFAERS